MFSKNLEFFRERIATAAKRAGRDPSDINLLAVSKTFPASSILGAFECGLRAFGENKVQEAVGKIEELQGVDIDWHFIGHLQKNKVKYIPGRFALVHSVDSLELAERLHQESLQHGCVTHVLIQVNVSGEASKSGVSPEQLPPLLKKAQGYSGISIEGLMTMPPFDADPEKARPWFRALRELLGEVNQSLGLNLQQLSMGMSQDFEVAIEEGATWIRVGTSLFGDRN